MITSIDIDRMLKNAFPAAAVAVNGADGKFELEVVDESFEGLNRVKRQQAVYKILNDHISSGAIHAVSMNLRTPSEAA